MFPSTYNKDVVKLIHLLSDNPQYYNTTSLNAEKFYKLLQKMIKLLEDARNGSNN